MLLFDSIQRRWQVKPCRWKTGRIGHQEVLKISKSFQVTEPYYSTAVFVETWGPSGQDHSRAWTGSSLSTRHGRLDNLWRRCLDMAIAFDEFCWDVMFWLTQCIYYINKTMYIYLCYKRVNHYFLDITLGSGTWCGNSPTWSERTDLEHQLHLEIREIRAELQDIRKSFSKKLLATGNYCLSRCIASGVEIRADRILCSISIYLHWLKSSLVCTWWQLGSIEIWWYPYWLAGAKVCLSTVSTSLDVC